MAHATELAALLVQLKAARTKYSTDERAGASDALSAVCSYLRSVAKEDSETRAPLIALLAALGDLDRGIVPELLKPQPYEGGPQKPLMEAMNLAAAAAAITLAVEAGTKKVDALKRVARETTQESVKLSEALRNIERGRATPAMTENYEFFVNTARSFKGHDAKSRADTALSIAKKMMGR